MKHDRKSSGHEAGLRIAILTAAVLMLAGSGAAWADEGGASFEGLGFLPGSTSSRPFGVSADGSVVVGDVRADDGQNFLPFRWEDGIISALSVPGTGFGHAHAVNADGSVIVGSSSEFGVGPIEALRWENGSVLGLGFLSGGEDISNATGISGEGSVVVGDAFSSETREAFRWENDNGGMVGLGSLPGRSDSSEALAISADGSVIVGYAASDAARNEAFRWEDGDMVGLGFFTDHFHSPGSIATAVNADGSVIVGSSTNQDDRREAVRWNNGSMEGLGTSTTFANSEALAVSADGSIVVGYESHGMGAFIWDNDNGRRNVKDVLVDDFGLDVTDWVLGRATGLSADGNVIVGWGVNPDGEQEGWIARLANAAFRWTTPGFGEWSDGENWDQGAAPGLADDAMIGAAGNYAIGLESDVDLTSLLISPAEDDDLQVTLGPAADAGPIAMHLGTLRVGGDDRTLAASEASLTLSDLSVTVFEDVTLGGTTVGTAKLAIAPGTAAVFESELRVGDQLTAGVLEITAANGVPATLESGALTVGGNDLAPGETSEVLVQGADASYSISGQVVIGDAANSYFEVAEGAAVSVGDALSVTIGHNSRLYVHGEDSSFSYRDGDGELRIEDGVAEFDDMATGAFFAARVGGGGDHSPDGEPGLGVRNGAALELSGDLKVGLQGSGFVAIEQEGRITAGDVNIAPPEAVDNTQSATVLVREAGVLESLDFILIGSAREEGGELLKAHGHLGVESGGQVNVLGTGGVRLDYGSLDVDGVTSEVRSLTGPLEIGNARATFTGGAFGSFESVAVQAPLGGGDPAQLVIAHSTVEAGNPVGTDVTVGGEGGGVIAMVDGLLDAEGGEVFIDHNGVIAGTGTVRGNVTGSGFISPGLSPGTLTIEGDYTQEAGGSLILEIAGLTPGAEHDVLEVTGDAILGGEIIFRFIDNFAPRMGDTFDLLAVGGSLDISATTFTVENLLPGFDRTVLATESGLQMTALNDGAFVPEPTTGVLALFAMGMLTMRRRRTRHDAGHGQASRTRQSMTVWLREEDAMQPDGSGRDAATLMHVSIAWRQFLAHLAGTSEALDIQHIQASARPSHHDALRPESGKENTMNYRTMVPTTIAAWRRSALLAAMLLALLAGGAPAHAARIEAWGWDDFGQVSGAPTGAGFTAITGGMTLRF